MSGAYLSEDGGRNWRMIHHAQLRSDIRCRPCFHPTDPKTLYASSGGQLRISRDRGRTFTPIGDLKGVRTLYAGVFMEGVYKSTDDGKTWTLKRNGLGHPENRRVSRVSLHRDGSLFAMVCAMRPAAGKPLLSEGVGLYRSKDGGETWQKVNASHPFLYPKEFTVHPKDSNRILVGVCDSSWEDQSGGLYTTADGGQTWQRIGRQGPQTFGGYFHPRHEGWIYMTLTEGAPGAGLWLSQDNGQTWKTFDELPFSNIQRITFDPSDETRLYVTTFCGSVWRGLVVP
jgi:photosystem II stability/assembly factor-like uncharacterized protein